MELRIPGIHFIRNSPNLEIGLNLFLFHHLEDRCRWREQFFFFFYQIAIYISGRVRWMFDPLTLKVRNPMCPGLLEDLDASPPTTSKSGSFFFPHLNTSSNCSLAKYRLSFQISCLRNKTLRCIFQVSKYLKIIS